MASRGGGVFARAAAAAAAGVLKVLEELRVPVHCVTGTSMGAIVGGTFASGMPLADMEKFVVGADWDDVFRDHPPRAEISMRRKADDYKTLFAPEYGVKDGGLAAGPFYFGLGLGEGGRASLYLVIGAPSVR